MIPAGPPWFAKTPTVYAGSTTPRGVTLSGICLGEGFRSVGRSFAVAWGLGGGRRVEHLLEAPGGCILCSLLKRANSGGKGWKGRRGGGGEHGDMGIWGASNVPSSLTKRISNAPALLRRMLASLYLSQKTYSLISLIQTQCLDLRVSQRPEADWWVTAVEDWWSVCFPLTGSRGSGIPQRTEGGPHRTSPQLAVPYSGVEAYPSRPVVFVDYQGVLVVVIDDLSGLHASAKETEQGKEMCERRWGGEIHTLGTAASRWGICTLADPCRWSGYFELSVR